MTALAWSLAAIWAVFWVGWIAVGFTAKRSQRTVYGVRARVVLVVCVVLLRVAVHPHGLEIHSVVLEVIGSALFVAGLAFAIWARVHIGRNWGMPMSEKEDAELVTTGPYRLVRNPIYSGVLLAGIGTAIALDLYVLVIVALVGAYFVYSARVEERTMQRLFPDAYPGYRARTKMLIPYVL